MNTEELQQLEEEMEQATEKERAAKLKELFPNLEIRVYKRGTSPYGANKYTVVIRDNDFKFSTTFTDSLRNTWDKKRSSNFEILQCIVSDAECYYYNDKLEDFADAFGYSDNVREAVKVFNACQKQYTNLLALAGSKGFDTLRAIMYNY